MKERTIIRNDNAKREDKTEYPIPAIREAVLNALVHRDYSSYTEGSYIQIRMFNDRIEIQSSGGLYGEVTTDTLASNKHDIRNKNLVRILEDIKVVENRGSGIFTMIKELRDMKLEPPVFEERRGDFWVTFKNHNLMTKEDLQWLRSLELELTENEALALTFVKRNKKITNGEYQRLNNINSDKAFLEIKKLIKKGAIKSNGIGSGTYYVLNHEVNNSFNISTASNNIKDKEDREKVVAQDNEVPPKITTQNNDIPPKINNQDEGVNRLQEILIFCKSSKSKKEIAEYLGLKNLNHFEKMYLKPLLDEKKLIMTIPQKPTSRNQKYIASTII